MAKLKKRDFWYDREVHIMLSIVKDKYIEQLMNKKMKRNKGIFVDIANELKKRDIVKNHVQIRNKFKSLKSDFLKAKRNKNKNGTKRQTSEHFELLDEIFNSCAVLSQDGVDIAEMDLENIKVEEEEDILMEDDAEFPDHEAETVGLDDAEIDFEGFKVENVEEEQQDFQTSKTEDNSEVDGTEKPIFRRIKRTKKQSYEKVVEQFTKDWRRGQQDLLYQIEEHDQKLLNQHLKKQEELLEKSLSAMEKILAKDREETAKMLQGFLNAYQAKQPSGASLIPEISSSNHDSELVPKSSPYDSDTGFT